MGDSRIVYGMALGKVNDWKNLAQGRTHGAITQADTTPDVTSRNLVYTINSGATTITDFDVTTPAGANGNQGGLFEGKVLKVVFLDSVTTVAGSRIYLADTNQTFNTNAVLDLVYHNSAWYETNRVNPAGLDQVVKTVLIGGTSSNLIVEPKINMYLLQGTAATPILMAISGGYIGQTITMIAGSNPGSVTSAGNLIFMNTLGVAFATSQGISFTKTPAGWLSQVFR